MELKMFNPLHEGINTLSCHLAVDKFLSGGASGCSGQDQGEPIACDQNKDEG